MFFGSGIFHENAGLLSSSQVGKGVTPGLRAGRGLRHTLVSSFRYVVAVAPKTYIKSGSFVSFILASSTLNAVAVAVTHLKLRLLSL